VLPVARQNGARSASSSTRRSSAPVAPRTRRRSGSGPIAGQRRDDRLEREDRPDRPASSLNAPARRVFHSPGCDVTSTREVHFGDRRLERRGARCAWRRTTRAQVATLRLLAGRLGRRPPSRPAPMKASTLRHAGAQQRTGRRERLAIGAPRRSGRPSGERQSGARRARAPWQSHNLRDGARRLVASRDRAAVNDQRQVDSVVSGTASTAGRRRSAALRPGGHLAVRHLVAPSSTDATPRPSQTAPTSPRFA
jgi:hypothetical protein